MIRFSLRKLWVCVPLAVWVAGPLAAEPVYRSDVQPSYYGVDRQSNNEQVKQHYLNEGRDYLRTYLRDSMLRFLADSGMAFDLDQIGVSATMDLTRLYHQENAASPLRTRLRVLASEDYQNYLNLGRTVPIKFEMDSDYALFPDLLLNARVEMPLDDLFQMQFGSRIRWSEMLNTRLEYVLRNGDRFYSGLSLGMDVNWADWHLAMDYYLSPDSTRRQRFSVGKRF